MSLVPKSPLEIGLPKKYDTWRANQREVVELSIVNNRRFNIIEAPTGSGKTTIYMAQSMLEGGRTCIVVQSKAQQDYVAGEFAGTGLVDIRGKSNYACSSRPDWTCKDGHVGNCPNKASTACPFTKSYLAAKTAPRVVTNYAFWIAIHRYGLGLGGFHLVIFDEAQSCPDELASSMSVPISFNEMDLLEREFPKTKKRESVDDWKLWATEMRIASQEAYRTQYIKVNSTRDPKRSWIQDLHHYRSMIKKFAQIATMRPGNWVWEEGDVGFQFDPIRYGQYAENRLLLGAPRITAISATNRRKTYHLMNIKDEDTQLIEVPSSFDPKRSPIYVIPSMRVDRNNPDITPLVMDIDRFIGPRINLNRNGLIQVTSFPYRDQIYTRSSFRQFMLSHWDGSPVAKAVEEYNKKGGVLISPSIHTGFNFPDDQCRFIAITKVPWRPTNSKIIKARQELDKSLSDWDAMLKIVQGSGRGDRSNLDWCETAIFDKHFGDYFYNKNRHFTPSHFQNRLIFADRVPPPMVIQ